MKFGERTHLAWKTTSPLEQLAASLPPQDFEPTPREAEERGLFDKVKDIFG